jgi:hypothetical protein
MAAQGCRIGRIKLRNGAEVRVIPSADEQYSKQAFSALGRALGHVGRLYEDELAGYALVVWNKRRLFNAFRHDARSTIGSNNMPSFVAEALRRENSEDDFRSALSEIFPEG